jgi:SAM-dependent methyltransferase
MDTFEKKFTDSIQRDSAYIKSWLVAWDYQVKLKKRKVGYDGDKPSDFFSYNGPSDLLKWMNWFHPVYPDYFPGELTEPLVAESRRNDQRIAEAAGLAFDFPNYGKNIGLNNAHDFLFPQLYPVPERFKIKNVIDFGAGYGRQANLWATRIDGIYVGMDAIPNSYCLQNLYYSKLGRPFYEYVESPGDFRFDLSRKGIYHIPTWRTDLLPDNSFDLVMFVQVLPELNSKLIRHVLTEFRRILKPGGMVYIRDHASIWKPAGRMDVGEFMKNNGFVLEFQPHLVLDGDLHGIPRIWRKADPAVIRSQTLTFEQKKKLILEDMDAASGGLLKKLAGKLKK